MKDSEIVLYADAMVVIAKQRNILENVPKEKRWTWK